MTRKAAPEPKRKAGRPAFEPTAEQRKLVRSLVSIGVEIEDIAQLVSVSLPTLRKHFWLDLQRGRVEGKARNTKRLHDAAQKGNVTAMIWLDKTRFGVRELDDQGKKVLQLEEAQNAEEGTAWDSLLPNVQTVQ